MINNLLLRMKLSNENPEVRLAALDKIPSSEQETFFEIAGNDPDLAVRREAVHRLDDESMLEKIWEREADPELKQSLRDKLNRRYIAILSEGRQVDLQFLRRIEDELLLITAVCSTPNPQIAAQVAELVKSDSGIVKILRNLDDYELGIKLLERLGENRELLMDIAETAVNPKLKEYARDKFIAEPVTEEIPDPPVGISSNLKEKLHAYENIIAEVKRLTGYIGADAAERLHGLKDKWHSLPEVSPSFMEVLEIEFKQACRRFEEGIEAAGKLQQDRLHRIDQLDTIYAETVKLLAAPSAQVKKEQLARLRKSWETIAENMTALEPLQERFEKACEELEARLQESRKQLAEYLGRLEEIIAELDAQSKLEEPDITRERRIELEKEVDELVEKSSGNYQAAALKERFHALNKNLRHKIHELHQVRDLERWEHYALKIVLCEQTEKLLENTNMHEVSREFKDIRHRWKEIGVVPHEKFEEINTRFHLVADELNRRCTEFFDALNKQREGIAAAKEAMCVEAEAMQYSGEWNKTGDRFKEMQKQWRELGGAQPEVENALSKRFRAACDVFFNARRIYLDDLQRQRDRAITAKRALCDEASALLESNPFELNRQSKELWEKWREAGSAGRDDRKLYEEFKAIFDHFYDRKRHEREDNLTRKKQVCTELKNLFNELDPLKLEQQQKRLRDLQDQWDGAGQIPRENEPEIRGEYDRLVRDIHKAFKDLHARYDLQVVELQQRLCEAVCAAAAGRDTSPPPPPPPELAPLFQLFENTAAAVAGNDQNYLAEFARKQDESLREMKKICTEFERLNGIETESAPAAISDMLADLNAALQNNIASASSDTQSKGRTARELRQRWYKAGVPPQEEISAIFARYRIAARLDAARE